MGMRQRMASGLWVPSNAGGDFVSPRVPIEPQYGLDFAGNTSYPSATPNTPVLAWNSTIVGSAAPFSIYPATYIWKSYPRPNNNFYQSYWSMIFYIKYETSWTQGEPPSHSYYGFHPWPDREASGRTPPEPAMEHKWEIAGFGDDRTATEDGETGTPIDYNRWFTHAATAELIGGNEVYTFYFDWPDTSSAKIIKWTHAQALAMVSDPAIIIGDAVWNRGREAPNAILRGFQFYDAVLSEANIAAELASPGSYRTPWYLKLNPTPSDVADESGNGNHPAWIDANRPALWTN
jgi:hypothetical protein